jgi:hypothetical protein
MKRGLLFAVAAVLFVLAVPGLSMGAGWVLYDNFNSGTINTALWKKSGSGAVSVVNGMAYFDHSPGQSANWLYISKSPEKVRGIRAKVRVGNATGDCKARIGGWIGKVSDNEYIFDFLAFEPTSSKPFYGQLVTIDAAGNYLANIGEVEFSKPQYMIGDMFLLETTFNTISANYTVYGSGSGSYFATISAYASDKNLVGIGTRSSSGTGGCDVYFDDVYVLYSYR